MSWLTEKADEHRALAHRQRRVAEVRRAKADKAKAAAEAVAQQRFAKWRAAKAQQLRERQAALTSAAQREKTAQEAVDVERAAQSTQHYAQWQSAKRAAEERRLRVQRLRAERTAGKKAERRALFESQFPTLVDTYVRTVQQWKKAENAARKRQEKHERRRPSNQPLHAAGRGRMETRPPVPETERLRLSMASTASSASSMGASTARSSSVEFTGGSSWIGKVTRVRRPAWNDDTTVSYD